MIRENALAKTEHLTFIDMQKGIIYVKLNLCNSYGIIPEKCNTLKDQNHKQFILEQFHFFWPLIVLKVCNVINQFLPTIWDLGFLMC